MGQVQYVDINDHARDATPSTSALVHAVQLFTSGSAKRAHLDRRPTGDRGLTPPRQRLVQVSGFQYPKTAYVLLGLQVRPVGDKHLAIGLRPQGLRAACRAQAASENPDTSSHHLDVKRTDIPAHRFALAGRVIVVGVVNRNQILRHDFSL